MSVAGAILNWEANKKGRKKPLKIPWKNVMDLMWGSLVDLAMAMAKRKNEKIATLFGKYE